MVNDSHPQIPQVQDKKKRYTTRDIKRAGRARRFQHITGQTKKKIFHGWFELPVWFHLQCSQIFGFWSYFLWKTWCAVIWCWGNWSIDVHVLVISEVPHIMVKYNILCRLKCCPLWAVDDKLIFIWPVVGHRVVFLEQAKGQDVSYSLGVIQYMIGISGEVTNSVGVCQSCVTMYTQIFSIGSISDIW